MKKSTERAKMRGEETERSGRSAKKDRCEGKDGANAKYRKGREKR